MFMLWCTKLLLGLGIHQMHFLLLDLISSHCCVVSVEGCSTREFDGHQAEVRL